MPAYKARETRQAVSVGARLRQSDGWNDIVIRNVSPRGLMGACAVPPARGEYVEVRCGNSVIVARVAWSRNGRFGLRTQDRIDLAALLAGIESRVAATGERRSAPRQQVRAVRRRTLTERAAASSRFARAFDFLSVTLVCAVLAGLAAGAAHSALARPLDRAAAALATN